MENDPQFGSLTEQELAERGEAYVLKTIPDGYTQEIVAVPDQPEDEPYRFEVNYRNDAGETFGLMAVGQMDEGFVETNFYDGSYKAASGLTLYFSPSKPGANDGTSAMLVAPSGNSFLLSSSLEREPGTGAVETGPLNNR